MTRGIMSFLMAGAGDTEYIREREVDVIYSPYPLSNHDLIEVRDGVYILREEGS